LGPIFFNNNCFAMCVFLCLSLFVVSFFPHVVLKLIIVSLHTTIVILFTFPLLGHHFFIIIFLHLSLFVVHFSSHVVLMLTRTYVSTIVILFPSPLLLFPFALLQFPFTLSLSFPLCNYCYMLQVLASSP
jgi:hypothetical protein